jgi:hypothetical protein
VKTAPAGADGRAARPLVPMRRSADEVGREAVPGRLLAVADADGRRPAVTAADEQAADPPRGQEEAQADRDGVQIPEHGLAERRQHGSGAGLGEPDVLEQDEGLRARHPAPQERVGEERQAADGAERREHEQRSTRQEPAAERDENGGVESGDAAGPEGGHLLGRPPETGAWQPVEELVHGRV